MNRFRNTPRRIKVGETAWQSHSKAARLADDFAALGLPELAAPLRDAVTTHLALRTDFTESAAAIDSRRRALVSAIAEGAISPQSAALELEEVKRSTVVEPVATDLALAGRRRVLVDAFRVLYDLGDSLLTDHLDPVVVQAAQEVITVAPDARGITADLDAVRAAPKAHQAWATMTDARERIERTWRVAGHLRGLGLTYSIPPPSFPREAWCWRNVDPVVSRVGRGQHPNLALAALIAAGANPGALTAAEVLELHAPKDPPPRTPKQPPRDPIDSDPWPAPAA